MKIALTTKQTKAFDILNDNTTKELLYGGGAGGGKSILGCFWLIHSCLKYPDTRWVMGRASLKILKETTFQSFLKVAKMLGLKMDEHFITTTAQDRIYPHSILFPSTGSVILMKDLFAYPADPEFDDLGSLEITGAFIDEGSQITQKAKEILCTRMRHNISYYNLIPKLLITSNPAKNWMYHEFYKPWKENLLPPDKQFIQSLVTDNDKIDPSYLENLKNLKGATRARLLLGEWEYDDDPATLMDYNAITDCFKAKHLPDGDKFITADIARFGKDKTVIVLWNGWKGKIFTYAKQDTEATADVIKHLMNKYNIPNRRVLADEDGLGAGVVDKLMCEGFLNGSKALLDENYKNLKSQCYYKLADQINKSGIYIDCDHSLKDTIVEELEQVKQYNMDKDEKKQVIPKDKVKELLGRSPDYSDAIMMRMWFELQPTSWEKIW